MDYPKNDAGHLAERVETFPDKSVPARWTIRDDNRQHYHGIVSLSNTPFYIELRWKPTSDGPEQLVGRYRLRLPELLAGDFIRFEHEGVARDSVRLRFYRGADGVIFIQARTDRPALPIGRVNLSQFS